MPLLFRIGWVFSVGLFFFPPIFALTGNVYPCCLSCIHDRFIQKKMLEFALTPSCQSCCRNSGSRRLALRRGGRQRSTHRHLRGRGTAKVRFVRSNSLDFSVSACCFRGCFKWKKVVSRILFHPLPLVECVER